MLIQIRCNDMSATLIFCFHVCCFFVVIFKKTNDAQESRRPARFPFKAPFHTKKAALIRQLNSKSPLFFCHPPVSDLPPPPEPPPDESRLEASGVANGAPSSLERSEYGGGGSQRRRGSGQRHADSKSRAASYAHQSP